MENAVEYTALEAILLSSPLDSISPNELALLSSVVAIAISDGLTADEVNTLGNFVAAVGTVLLTIAAQRQFLDTPN